MLPPPRWRSRNCCGCSSCAAPAIKTPAKSGVRRARGSAEGKQHRQERAGVSGDARLAVIRAYARWLHRPGRIDDAAARILSRGEWSGRDRALFMELLYGVVRWHGRLDWLIERLSERKGSPQPVARAAAAVGLYQLFFLEKIPDYAAVDTAVEVVRRAAGPGLAGWVNVLLRRAAREREYWLTAAPKTSNTSERLAVVYSHPAWLVSRWGARMRRERLERLLEWNNRRPQVSLRLREGEASSEWEQSRLIAGYHLLPHGGDADEMEPVRRGVAVAQDPAQGLAGLVLGPQPGEEILDICAAPGGKTAHLGDLCRECRITATDKSPERLEILRESLNRLHLANVTVEPYDVVLTSRQRFNAVLVDAPCTGTGVLARRPDLRWRLKPGDVRRMASIQAELLRYAADHLKPGGRIVYSTCSLEPEENEGVTDDFLAAQRAFTVQPPPGTVSPAVVDAAGRVRLDGPEFGTDGVYVVCLKRS